MFAQPDLDSSVPDGLDRIEKIMGHFHEKVPFLGVRKNDWEFKKEPSKPPSIQTSSGFIPILPSSIGQKEGVDGLLLLVQSEDTSNNTQNPAEESFMVILSDKFIPGSDPSNGDARVEIGVSGAHSKNGRSANDPLWVKYRGNILFVLFGMVLLTALTIILVIILNGPKSAEIITVIDTNELIGPTAGPYYHIDLSGFGGKLQRVSNEKIAYLEGLGVKSVIISQVLEFDDAGSKGVVNFTKVDVEYGGQSEFTDLVSRIKEKGMKVILQFIPNHSSIQHEWFRDETLRDKYYVILDASQDSSWASYSTPNEPGSAWSEVPVNEELWFLHQCTTGEPDLNYRNPSLIKEINGALQFWYSLGVDGFLLSEVSYLVEDLNKLNDQKAMINHPDNADVVKKILDFSGWHFIGRNPPFALVELTGIDLQQTSNFYSKTTAVISNSLADLDANFTAHDLRKTIEETISATPHNPVHWRLGSLSHRPGQKFGKERLQALTLVAALLPGQLVLNYGDEIRLSSDENYQQKNLDGSSAQFFREILQASVTLSQTRTGYNSSEYKTSEDKPGIFIMTRANENTFIVAANFNADHASVPLEDLTDGTDAEVVAATQNAGSVVYATITAGDIELPPHSAAVLKVFKS